MSRLLIFALLLVAAPLWAADTPDVSATTLVNRLDGHSSPYLNMHGKDPVAWQQWGPEAFEIARRENRLLYVSVGYFACHWCHVMQRESYQNPEIAEWINRHYVPIKIDRELLPGIDKRLMDFAERTRGRGGWPLNIFLTPDGYPLLAVLYELPERFQNLLVRLQARWSEEADELTQLAHNAQFELEAEFESRDGKTVASLDRKGRSEAFLRRALSMADDVSGGFGNQTKFPSTPQLEAMLEIQREEPLQEVGDFLRLTLDQMASQGMRDHLGGGFFRYTVDQNWQVPHFEKMLYDNAQLAYVYLLADPVFSNKDYRHVAFDTLDFVQRELAAGGGGYIASLSAVDAHGVEGAAYLWTEQDLGNALDQEELALLRAYWSLSGPLEAELGWLPRQSISLEQAATDSGLDPQQAGAIFERASSKLLKARQGRLPPRDIKVLAAWNGLLLRAMAKAASHPAGARFKAPAADLAAFIRQRMWQGGQLSRSLSDASVKANLADYAHVAEGLLEWYRVSADPENLAFAEQLVRTAWRLFHNPRGWKLSLDNLLKYGVEKPALEDGALASASAVLLRSALALLEMGRLQDLEAELEQAREAGHTAPAFWGVSHLRL